MSIWHKNTECPRTIGLIVIKSCNGSLQIENADFLYDEDLDKFNMGEIQEWAWLKDFVTDYAKKQAEINRLRKALDRILNYNSVKEQTDKYYHIVMDVREIARKALNGESEGK